MVIKSIRAFLLLYAGLAIILHSLIPHDHHLTVPAGELKESCNHPHEKSDHRPLYPAHCLTLNDLAAGKFSPVNIRLLVKTSYVSVIWHPEYIFPPLNLSQAVFEFNREFFPDLHFPAFSQFRAPPLIS